MRMIDRIASDVFRVAKRRSDYSIDLLRKMVRIPSLTCEEEDLALFVIKELSQSGCDVKTDQMGSVIATIGNGSRTFMFDAHLDTVDVGDPQRWSVDPFGGILKDGMVFGRGACDDKASLASMMLAATILAEMGVPSDSKIIMAFTVQEEDCEGLALRSFLEESQIKPECVVIGEPSNLEIMRGHRGRTEIEVTVRGKCCHSSMPELGDNAIYKMASLVSAIQWMGSSFISHPFLGQGSIAVTSVECDGPSHNAVPDLCRIYIDRRIVPGDTPASVVREIEEVGRALGAEVRISDYDGISYKGVRKTQQRFFPPWMLDDKHALTEASVISYRLLFGAEPKIGKWNFSTDGTYSMGKAAIPTIGFGPGDPRLAHTTDESVDAGQVWKAGAFYALLPFVYFDMKG